LNVRADENCAEDEDVQVFESESENAGGATSSDAQTSGDDSDEYEDEEDEGVNFSPSNDVTTNVYFPDYPDRNFPLDTPITALIVFSNTGSKTFNISHCVSSLQSPFDLNYYVQNFTSGLMAVIVEPHRQITIEFKFIPDKNLEANDFHLSGYIVYNDTVSDRVYVSSFVNTTMSLVDTGIGPLFTTVTNTLVIGLLVFVLVYGLNALFGKKTKGGKAPRAKPASSAAATSADGKRVAKIEDQVIPAGFETAMYKQAAKSKAVKKSKGDGNKKKGNEVKKAGEKDVASTGAKSSADSEKDSQ